MGRIIIAGQPSCPDVDLDHTSQIPRVGAAPDCVEVCEGERKSVRGRRWKAPEEERGEETGASIMMSV